MAWYRRLIAQKFDGSKRRSYPGRPPITPEIEALIVRMARENSGWGYDCIVGAVANLGHRVSDQTVGNILRRYGIPPAPQRSQKTTWKEFISAPMAVLTGADFFTLVRRSFATSGADRVHRALSLGEEPRRQAEPTFVPDPNPKSERCSKALAL